MTFPRKERFRSSHFFALSWGCQACRSVFVKCLVKFDLESDLKFEISDGKIW